MLSVVLDSRSMAKKQKRKLLVQFAEYMITGGVWFWSGYILIVLLDDHIGLFAANFIGNAVGITLNFLLERYWVFKTKKQAKLSVMAKRYVIYTALNAFLLNYAILYGLKEYVGLKPEIGQFIASAFFTGWNYYWYKNWVFKTKSNK
jgi:putative flippase GtrA